MWVLSCRGKNFLRSFKIGYNFVIYIWWNEIIFEF